MRTAATQGRAIDANPVFTTLGPFPSGSLLQDLTLWGDPTAGGAVLTVRLALLERPPTSAADLDGADFLTFPLVFSGTTGAWERFIYPHQRILSRRYVVLETVFSTGVAGPTWYAGMSVGCLPPIAQRRAAARQTLEVLET